MPDLSWLNELPQFAPEPVPQSNWFAAGLKTGINQGFGALGGAAQAVGTATGMQGLADYGKSVADERGQMVKASQRLDLEQAPWYNPTKIGYELAKAIPSMAAVVGGSALAGEVAGPVAAGGLAARIGSAIPSWLGGGAQALPRLAGAAAAGYPLSVGGNVEAYKQGHPGEELTPGGAAGALALGAPEAALGAIAPASFHQPIEGGLARRLLMGAKQGATVQAPVAAAQQALTGAMDPTKTVTDRARDVVDAAVGGATVGGAFGAGMRIFQRTPPQALATDTDKLLEATTGASANPEPEPPNPADQTAAAAQQAAIARGPTPGPETRDLMGSFGQLSEAQLRQQAADLAGKENPTPAEMATQAALEQEIKDRTPPGGDPEQHELFTPDDMGRRKLLADQYEQQARQRWKLPEQTDVLDGVTNDVEMIRKLKNDTLPALGDKIPKELQQMAADLGFGKVPINERVAEQLQTTNDLLDKAAKEKARGADGQAQVFFDRGIEAQKKLKDLQRLADLHQQADEPLAPKAEETPAAEPAQAAATDAETATAPAAGEPARDPALPEIPEGIKPEILAHFKKLSNLFGLLKNEDPGEAGRVLTALSNIASSKGKRGVRGKDGALAILDEYKDQIPAEAPAEAPPAAEAPAAAEPAAPAEEPAHPFIEDGSKPAWMTPSVEPVVGAVPPPKFTPRPIPVGTEAERTAGAQQSLRDEASQRINSLPEGDPTRAKLEAAMRVADAGSHSALAETLNAIDKAQAAARPEGPWQGTDEKIVGSPSVQPKLTSFVGSIMRALGLGNIRTLVLHPNDVNDPNLGLNGDYKAARQTAKLVQDDPNHSGHVYQFGPDNKDFALYVKPDASDADTLTYAGHEVGHIADKVLLNNAPKSTQNAVHKEFQQQLKAAGMKGQDLARLKRGTPEYAQQFGEFFADKTEEWIRKRSEAAAGADTTPRTAVDRFFAKVADKWRDVYSAITGDPVPEDSAVHKFLDSVVERNKAATWMGDADNKVRFKLGGGKPETVEDMNNSVGTAVGGAQQAASRIIGNIVSGVKNLRGPTRRQALSAADGPTLVNEAMRAGSTAIPQLYAIGQAVFGTAHALFKKFIKTNDAAAALDERGKDLLGRYHEAVIRGFDPSKAAKDQAWIQTLPAADRVRATAMADQFKKEFEWTRQNHQQAFKVINDVQNNYHVAAATEGLAALNDAVRDQHLGGPIDGYDDQALRNIQMDNVTDAATNRNNSIAALQKNRDAVEAHINAVDAQATALDAAEQAGMTPDQIAKLKKNAGDSTRATVDPLRYALKQADGKLEASQRPYVPLGRTGTHMVAGELPLNAEGRTDPANVQEMQKRLDAAGLDAQLLADHDNGKVFVRMDESQARTASDVFQKARADGVLKKDADVVHGPVDDLGILDRAMPSSIKNMANRIRAQEMNIPADATPETKQAYHDARDQIAGDMMRSYISSLGDGASGQIWSLRDNTLGWSKDGISNMIQRLSASAHNTAATEWSHARATTLADMQAEIQAMKRLKPGQSGNVEDVNRLNDIANEILLREKQKGYETTANPFGVLTRATHIMSVGASPAYVFTIGSQLPTLVLPELGKTHGFRAAVTEMARAAPDVLKILKSAIDFKTGRFIIDYNDMIAAGVSPKYAEIAARLDNQGGLTSSATVYGLSKEGDHHAWAYRVSNLLGYSAEMMSKLWSALPAGALYDQNPVRGMTRDQYVRHATDQSNMDYGPGGTPRLLSKHGIAGTATPLVAQFQRFHVSLMEKYYREMQNVIAPQNAGDRAASTKFLLGHVAAIVALAGTTGLPGATLFANVYDKLANALTGKDDHDIEASYRVYLAHTFGAGVGEVLAKGLPRAAGADFSHLGEGKIIPLTDLLASKRKFEEAYGDWADRMLGPVAGEVGDIFEGGRDITNGFYMQGLTKLLPGELKNLFKAYHMTAYGYEDNNGQQLPLTPGAKDIMLRVLGIESSKMAEYRDEKETLNDLVGMRTYRQQNITKHIELGINHQNRQEIQDALDEAVRYTVDHPGLVSPLAHVGRGIEKFSRQGAIARGLGMVLGQKPQDLGVGAATGYGNWRNQ